VTQQLTWIYKTNERAKEFGDKFIKSRLKYKKRDYKTASIGKIYLRAKKSANATVSSSINTIRRVTSVYQRSNQQIKDFALHG